MIEIIQAFDEWTDNYTDVEKKLYGFCELMHKTQAGSDQPMPVKVVDGNSNRGEYAALDDRYQLITWFRLPGGIDFQDEIDGENWAFGLDNGEAQRANLLMVIATRVELGERWIFDFVKALPKSFKIDGYQIIHIDKRGITLDADHETIYNRELGRTVYEKHRFTWNIYALSPISVEYILCPTAVGDDCVDSFVTEQMETLVTDTGQDCLIQE